jgi:hypothetical protein
VTHAQGYTGAGGGIEVTVGIDPTSAFAAQMIIPTQNVVNTWNGRLPTTGNLNPTGVGAGQVDYESTLLHEMEHSLGLAHVNAATRSGLAGASRNFTKATDSANNVFDINPGTDGIIGSADDIRGDDQNLNYFRIADNNPVATDIGVVDSTTYSRDLANLPVGDTYSRTPTVRSPRRSASSTPKRLCSKALSAARPSARSAPTNSRSRRRRFYFNTGFNWSFNQESNIQIGAPGALAPLAFGLIILASTRRRRS